MFPSTVMFRRSSIVFVAFVALALVTPRAEARSFQYVVAARGFSALSLGNRALLQVLMTAAGYFNGVPVPSFTRRLFKGTKRFQAENGYPATGVLTRDEFDRLFRIATRKFDEWGFQKVAHPTRGHPIWIPLGLGLVATRNPDGIIWTDPRRRISISYTTVPNVGIDANFLALSDEVASAGATVHYKVIKHDWFVISYTRPNGVDGYMRYHQDGQNVTGFTLEWDNAKGIVNGERIAIIMSGSLWSAMSGATFPNPPRRNLSVATAPNPAPTPPHSTPTPPTAKADQSKPRFFSGTGFFVSSNGEMVTNAHVVEGCEAIRVKTDDGAVDEAKVLALDKTNDLAVLKLSLTPKHVASLRIGVRLGEGVAVFGYPHADILSTSGNFTLGNVTALSGMGDDSRYFQISAPVQSGNSGGPLLDMYGNVVGVVSAKLNALKVAILGGDLPQNVNFAVKSAILATFLDSNRIRISAGAAGEKQIAPADLADKAKAISAFILCKKH